MKRRILCFGVAAAHDQITTLRDFGDPRSVSDFDAFLFDPDALKSGDVGLTLFQRRQREIRDLIHRKGGIVICMLRPLRQYGVNQHGAVGCYELLRQASAIADTVAGTVRAGEGSQWELRNSAAGVLRGYFRILQKLLRFEAFLELTVDQVERNVGTVLAVNSIQYPLSAEFVIGQGRLCFVPLANATSADQMGAAVRCVVEDHFGGPTEIQAPSWVDAVAVPGADNNAPQIAMLVRQRGEIEAEISKLEAERGELLNYRSLLFGYGKNILEPVVRKTLTKLGFSLPQEWIGDWDFEIGPELGKTAIGEIEGSEGQIDVQKYRQLLDYFQSEVLEGRTHKGILVGNGYRTKEPSAEERQNQFTEHALRGARQNGFCLLPATELFKALSAVLASTGEEKQCLKSKICESILGCVGVWMFQP